MNLKVWLIQPWNRPGAWALPGPLGYVKTLAAHSHSKPKIGRKRNKLCKNQLRCSARLALPVAKLYPANAWEFCSL